MNFSCISLTSSRISQNIEKRLLIFFLLFSRSQKIHLYKRKRERDLNIPIMKRATKKEKEEK